MPPSKSPSSSPLSIRLKSSSPTSSPAAAASPPASAALSRKRKLPAEFDGLPLAKRRLTASSVAWRGIIESGTLARPRCKTQNEQVEADEQAVRRAQRGAAYLQSAHNQKGRVDAKRLESQKKRTEEKALWDLLTGQTKSGDRGSADFDEGDIGHMIARFQMRGMLPEAEQRAAQAAAEAESKARIFELKPSGVRDLNDVLTEANRSRATLPMLMAYNEQNLHHRLLTVAGSPHPPTGSAFAEAVGCAPERLFHFAARLAARGQFDEAVQAAVVLQRAFFGQQEQHRALAGMLDKVLSSEGGPADLRKHLHSVLIKIHQTAGNVPAVLKAVEAKCNFLLEQEEPQAALEEASKWTRFFRSLNPNFPVQRLLLAQLRSEVDLLPGPLAPTASPVPDPDEAAASEEPAFEAKPSREPTPSEREEQVRADLKATQLLEMLDQLSLQADPSLQCELLRETGLVLERRGDAELAARHLIAAEYMPREVRFGTHAGRLERIDETKEELETRLGHDKWSEISGRTDDDVQLVQLMQCRQRLRAIDRTLATPQNAASLAAQIFSTLTHVATQSEDPVIECGVLWQGGLLQGQAGKHDLAARLLIAAEKRASALEVSSPVGRTPQVEALQQQLKASMGEAQWDALVASSDQGDLQLQVLRSMQWLQDAAKTVDQLEPDSQSLRLQCQSLLTRAAKAPDTGLQCQVLWEAGLMFERLDNPELAARLLMSAHERAASHGLQPNATRQVAIAAARNRLRAQLDSEQLKEIAALCNGGDQELSWIRDGRWP